MKLILVGKHNGKRVVKWLSLFLWALLVIVAAFFGAMVVLTWLDNAFLLRGWSGGTILVTLFSFVAVTFLLCVVLPLARRLRLPLDGLPGVGPPIKLPAPFERFFSWLFSWRPIRAALFLGVCLATLVALFYAEENFRGKRAWKAYVREQTAKGEKLTLAEFIPLPVPDDQNFVLCSLLKPILVIEFVPVPRTLYDGKSRRTVPHLWRDTNGWARLARLDRTWGASKKLHKPSENELLTNGWIDLAGWQAEYRAGTNLIGVPTGATPATEVLVALRPLEPDVAELQEEAARRPLARWPIYYDTNAPWGILLPHLAHGKRITSLLQLRSAARLAAGDAQGGLADIELGLRLTESFRDEPFLISQLVRSVCHEILLQPVKEGLARHQLSAGQLGELQKKLGSVDLLAAYRLSVRAERAMNCEWDRFAKQDINWQFGGNAIGYPYSSAHLFFRFAPSGWIYQNQLRFCRLHDQFSLPAVDVQTRRVHPPLAIGAESAVQQSKGPFSVLAKLIYMHSERFLPGIASGARKFGHGQTQLDQAVLACALERFRLAHGQYPESLDALVPRFIEKMPHDLITGQPLKYRRTEDGLYLLYSVGWNEKDDSGVEAKSNIGTPEPQSGDWVWKLPKP